MTLEKSKAPRMFAPSLGLQSFCPSPLTTTKGNVRTMSTSLSQPKPDQPPSIYRPSARPFLSLQTVTDNLTVVEMGLDAEWVSKPGMPNKNISVQVARRRHVVETKNPVVIFEHPEMGLGKLPTWQGETPLPVLTGLRECDPVSECPRLQVKAFLFFSFGDVTAFFGRRLGSQIQSKMEQKRRMSIDRTKNGKHNDDILLDYHLTDGETVYRVSFKPVDICAMMGMGGLGDYAKKVGLNMGNKTALDDLKSRMDIAYMERFETFLDYAGDDAAILFDIYDGWRGLRAKLYETVGVPLESSEEPELTTGSFVAKLLKRWLESQVIVNGRNPSELFTDNKVDGLDYITTKAGVDYLASRKSEFSSQFLALVQGGRAKNENPMNARMSGVIGDIDISGCYGNGLCNQVYPIGLPTVIQTHLDKPTYKTLKQTLDKLEPELVPGCWMMVLDCPELPFEQTLMPSKDADSVELDKEQDEDVTNVDAPFGLYLRELKRSVLTHDILQVLRAHLSPRQFSVFANAVQVTAVMFYPRSQQVRTADELYETIANHKDNRVITKTTRKGQERVIDNRSRAWLGVPLSDFIKPLLAARKVYKTARNNAPKGSQDYLENDAIQEAYKLVVNTTYGVIASPYFTIGNVVVGNNITARARALIYMMVVALNTQQSITDGGGYDLNLVRFRKGATMPSLDEVAKMNRKHADVSKRPDSYVYGALGGKSWEFLETRDGVNVFLHGDSEVSDLGAIDKLAWQHLQDFYKGCDIDILFANDGQGQFSFEHKDIYREFLTQSQTNYRLTTFSGETKIKARGHALNKTGWDENGNPVGKMDKAVAVFFDELSESLLISPSHENNTSIPLKINAAKKLACSKTMNPVRTNGLLAGDSIVKRSSFRPISMSMFLWPNIETRETWEKMNDRHKAKTGWGIEAYYIDADGNLDYETAIQDIQLKIDAGQKWVTSPNSVRYETLPTHPYLTGC